MSMDVYIETC